MKLELVLDALPDVAMLVDSGHRILYANQACRSAVNLRLEELVGAFCPQVMHGLGTPYPGCPLEESVAGGCVAVGKEVYLTEIGRWVYSGVYPTGELTSEGKPIFLHTVRDITDAKVQEERLLAQHREQVALDQMLRHSLADSAIEVQLGTILDDLLAIPWLGIQSKGAILLVDERDGNLRMATQRGMAVACVEKCQSVSRGSCLCGRAIETGEIVFADALDDRHEVRYEGIAAHGHYCVPIRSGGKVRGVLTAYLDAGHARSDAEERFLLATADVVAGIIEREAARASSQLFRAMLDRARDAVLVAAADTFRFVDANEEASRRLGYTREEFRRLAVTEVLRDVPSREVLDQRSADLRTKGSILLEEREYAKDGTVIPVEASVSMVRWEGREYIVVVSRDITERRRAEGNIQRGVARLRALREVDVAITSSFDHRVTLSILLSRALAHLEVDAADVLIQNAHAPMLEFAAGLGFRTKIPRGFRVRVGEGLAGRAALERRTVIVEDLARPGGALVRGTLFHDEGFLACVGVPLVVKGRVLGVIEVFLRRPFRPDGEWIDFLEALAGQAAIALDNAFLVEDLQRSNVDLSLAYDTTIEGWSRALDLRDKETEGHSLRVTDMAVLLARFFGLPEADLVHIRRGALLHDIGKVGIPDGILLKPGALSDEEWVIMRRHPTLALELLSPIAHLRPALDIPYCHHEKWDGTGYPRKLKGEEIPVAARLFAVVDVWDALRSDRPYRKAWPDEKIRAHIASLRGTHFDPRVADAMLAVEWPPHPGG
ncbi:MAG: GAF domain-containing protein [Deltaproteobacteria bacterium]|nr:GAF domain-containing protein [Deltaproteobacteria bacterium]